MNVDHKKISICISQKISKVTRIQLVLNYKIHDTTWFMKDKRKFKLRYVYIDLFEQLGSFQLTTQNCTFNGCTHNYITDRFLSKRIELNVICNIN